MINRRSFFALALSMLVGMFVFFPLQAIAAEKPSNIWIEPSDANGIPAEIDAFQAQTGGISILPVYTYQLYLPGNADLSACFLSWDGGMQMSVDGVVYDSGECPIPPVNETKTYTLINEGATYATIRMVTYQGSAAVEPVFIEIDEAGETVRKSALAIDG